MKINQRWTLAIVSLRNSDGGHIDRIFYMSTAILIPKDCHLELCFIRMSVWTSLESSDVQNLVLNQQQHQQLKHQVELLNLLLLVGHYQQIMNKKFDMKLIVLTLIYLRNIAFMMAILTIKRLLKKILKSSWTLKHSNSKTILGAASSIHNVLIKRNRIRFLKRISQLILDHSIWIITYTSISHVIRWIQNLLNLAWR